ncbi:sensor histidine kinase [Methylobacterium sp. J-070]|uniref:sensor histidine kinase n=1 Tax=Methylobacterium sp. J-070 TaxID=2836650 RepID=UPI001FB9A8D2|nr:HWE histidine kinase domain-containing protein [Methylobacterium sp. J-070]MCJ2050294.1 HAMP domain-containing protein [Methylobacterium sp. J-070]
MLTARISALIALALAPAIALQTYNLYELHGARAAAVRTTALQQSQAIAADLGQFGEGMRQMLAILAEDPSIQRQDAKGCTAYLHSVSDKLPGAFALAVARADGQVVCNTLGSAPGAYSLAKRGYFQEAMRTGGFAVGDFVLGMLTRRPTIQFATALRDDDGRPSGIVLASIDLDWLAQRFVDGGLPQSATLTVSDRDGVVLVRVPDASAWVGRKLPPERLAALRDAPLTNDVRESAALDGRQRILGIRTPTGALKSLTVTVGIDRELAFADVDTAMRRGLELIAASLLLAVIGAFLAGRYFIRQPVERLVRAATAWRRGDLTARTGVSGNTEFGRLGTAFDEMAASLGRHESNLRNEIACSHALRAQQTTLLHELNHRVKNTLATVQSLARQSRGGEEQAAQLEARILALSKTHDLLTRDEWTGASLSEVAENELGPYRNSVDHFDIAGPPLNLPPRCVLAIGMAIHELTTNAAKYGALSGPTGRIAVKWRILPGEGAARVEILWRESGGPPVTPPTRRGFGTRLITGAIMRELDGSAELDFQPSGLVCRLALPLPRAQPRQNVA